MFTFFCVHELFISALISKAGKLKKSHVKHDFVFFENTDNGDEIYSRKVSWTQVINTAFFFCYKETTSILKLLVSVC